MPPYRYKALDARGELLTGRMDAANEPEVIARLQEQGHLPVEVCPTTGPMLGDNPWKPWRRPALAGALLVQFTQQLATLLATGQPLDRALSILADAPGNSHSQRVIGDIGHAVRGGAALSAALEQRHGLFSRLYVNMVRAGEAGGSLHETLQRLADYLERSQELKARVVNALIYPAILMVVVGGALLFLLGYVVPQFAQMYESLDVALPWFTAAVLAVGLFVRQWWIVPVVVPALALLWTERKRRDAGFRLAFDGWLLRRPMVGDLLAKLETARFARTLGMLLCNGVPLLAGLGIARNVLGNHALAADVGDAAESVKNGASLAAALGRHGRLPCLAQQMIQVGEESGTLDGMLLKTAEIFERESARAIDRMLAALVPLITLLLAAIVGVVIVAVLVPLYDLTNAIG